MRVATIDIGTNSVLLLVAERSDEESGDAPLRPLLERATITRLGEGVDKNRRLLDAAAERTLTCLAEYARELRACGVTRLEAVGTSAMRDAEGGQAFVARAKEILGVAPRTIDGQEEARLTFAGALSGLPQTGKVAVFDIGGGSTEIIVGTRDALAPNERHIADSISLNIGSVRLFERHVRSDPPTREELALVAADITSALATAPRPEPGSTLVGVAGTVTQLAALDARAWPRDAALGRRGAGREARFTPARRASCAARHVAPTSRRARGRERDRSSGARVVGCYGARRLGSRCTLGARRRARRTA